jgi:hypothetical protein
MSLGILIIYMAKKKYPFTTANELNDMIGQYFNDIEEKHSPMMRK